MRRPRLDPALTILLRPDGEVQVGWDPERAILINPPAGVGARRMVSLLHHVDGSRSREELTGTAAAAGVGPLELDVLLAELRDLGALSWVTPPGAGATLTVHVHGDGQLSDAISDALAVGGTRLTRSRNQLGVPREWPEVPALVVLADGVIADPYLVAELVSSRVAHLPVRLRDGTGLVGPLVLPGRSSCLRCADLHRTDADPAWPTLAAQLLGQVGHGSAAAVRATVGIASGQVEHVLRGHVMGEGPPRTLNATIEVDPRRAELHHRAWSAHPRCGCGAYR